MNPFPSSVHLDDLSLAYHLAGNHNSLMDTHLRSCRATMRSVSLYGSKQVDTLAQVMEGDTEGCHRVRSDYLFLFSLYSRSPDIREIVSPSRYDAGN